MVSLEETQKQLKRQQPEDEPLEELPEDLPDVRRARPKKSYVACAVLPSRHAIVIRLESTETNEAADVEVLKQSAAGIDVTGQPPLGQPGETVALAGGARRRGPRHRARRLATRVRDRAEPHRPAAAGRRRRAVVDERPARADPHRPTVAATGRGARRVARRSAG